MFEPFSNSKSIPSTIFKIQFKTGVKIKALMKLKSPRNKGRKIIIPTSGFHSNPAAFICGTVWGSISTDKIKNSKPQSLGTSRTFPYFKGTPVYLIPLVITIQTK